MNEFWEVAALPSIGAALVVLAVKCLIEIAKALRDKNDLGNIK